MAISINDRKGRRKGFRYNLSRIILKLIGWKVKFELPDTPKFLLIAFPHTSNWDLPIMLLISMKLGVRLNWVAKDSLFIGFLGKYLKWLGGIPVYRNSRSNFTQQVIELYNKAKNLVVVIAPEGTRSKVEYWKSGFYHIAKGAKIPIAMGFLDYAKKIGGIGPAFYPSDNIEKDLKLLNDFYEGMKGKFAERSGLIRLRTE
jgi:1-acyl-sn-glycerol-3-phosphate acyltransferase